MAEELTLGLLDDLGGENDGLGDDAKALLYKHSGRYVKERNPKLYQAIQLLIKWGVAYGTIAEELKVSPNLVSAVGSEISVVSLETHKEEILAGLRRFSRGALRMMIEAVEGGEKIPLGTLMLAFGIGTDKEALLSGGVTSRVEHVEDPEVAEFRRLMMSMRPGMGCEPRMIEQSAPAGAVVPEGLGPVVDMVPLPVTGNLESPDKAAATPDNTMNTP